MREGTKKRMFIMLAIAAVILGGVVGWNAFKQHMIAKFMRALANPSQTVSTIVAKKSKWQPTIRALGNLVASQQASLSAEVGGLVTAIHFKSGEKVHAGQVLVELNAVPLKAQLGQLQAEAGLALQNLKRDEAQLRVQAVSRAVVDSDRASLKSAQARVKAQEALIAQKAIVAPFSGRLGIRHVNLGQYLAPGASVVTLQKLDPMEVDFSVPQDEISLIHVGMPAQVKTNAVPGKAFAASVTAIEPQVDPSTRNLTIRASIPNPDGLLLPGLFATVRVNNGPTRQYITLPNAAVTYNPYGATVFVVTKAGEGKDGKPELKAKQRFVTTGLTRGDQVAILSGLKEGETVVSSGQMKLRNGSTVVVNNKVQPSDNPNPSVPDS